MPVESDPRTSGQQPTYPISHDAGAHFIERAGVLNKRVGNPAVATVSTAQATPALMRHMAIADTWALSGRDEQKYGRIAFPPL